MGRSDRESGQFPGRFDLVEEWQAVSLRAGLEMFGLDAPASWPWTVVLAVAWLALMLGYSPVADRIATRWVAKPPTLGAFRPLQQSTGRLIAGIVVAWVL